MRKIIIVGYGQRGQELHVAFNAKEEVEVIGTVDTNPEKRYIHYVGAPWYNDWSWVCPPYSLEDALASPAEIMVISTPDFTHADIACRCLRAGKHIYLEKPMAITGEECELIMQTAADTNRTVYVGHNLRHFTVFRQMKEIIDNGEIGEVKAVWCRHPISYGRFMYFADTRWHRKQEYSKSLLVHKACHDIDLIHWFAGGHTIRAVGMGKLAVWHTQPGADVEDLASVMLELDNGVQATYAQCHFAFTAAREYMIHGTKGMLVNEGDRAADAVVKLHDKRRIDMSRVPSQEYRFDAESGHIYHGDADKAVIEDFMTHLAAGKSNMTDAAWAVKAAHTGTLSMRNRNIPLDVW